MNKRILGVIAAAFLLVMLLPLTARAANTAYAILYNDGTLVFQDSKTPESGRKVKKTYAVDLTAKYDYFSHQPWYNERESVRVVSFSAKLNPTSTAYWFDGCKNLERINNIQYLDTSNVTDMSSMFALCSGLTALDVSHFNTSNVTDMSYMFASCSKLAALDVSRFDTSNVKYMGDMFYDCSGLTMLDVSRFDTSNVKYMGDMFYDCSGLTMLDVSGFNTAKVESMNWMFSACSDLKTIYASDKFITLSVTEGNNMFTDSKSLVGGNGTKYNDSHTDVPYARIDTASAPGYFTYKAAPAPTPTPMPEPVPADGVYAIVYDDTLVFQNGNTPEPGKNVTKIYEVDLNAVYSYHAPWREAAKVQVVNFKDKVSPTSTAYWFAWLSIERIDNIQNLDTSRVTNMCGMFSHCSGLKELDLSRFDTANVTDMSYMFEALDSKLTTLDVSRFNTSKVTTMRAMFSGCSSLTTLDMSGFDTSNVENMSEMFAYCSKLKTIYASDKFTTVSVTSSSFMFSSCKALVGGNKTVFNSSYTSSEYARIDTASAPGYFTYKAAPAPVADGVYAILYNDGTLVFQNGNVPESGKTVIKTYALDMNAVYVYANEKPSTPWYDERESVRVVNFADKISPASTAFWFFGCSNLQRVENISNLDTSNAVSMGWMFLSCAKLSQLDLSSFKTSKVTVMTQMFAFCKALTELDISGFDTAKVLYMGAMFVDCGKLTALDVSDFNTANVTNMSKMFSGCSSLKTLYVSDKFTTASVTTSDDMFKDCTSLIGGNGTKYNDSYTGVTYARIDTASTPGYFTDKNAPAYTVSGAQNGNEYKVTLTNPAPVTVAVLYFDAGGKFLSAAIKDVEANAGSVSFPLTAAHTTRVTLLGVDYRPLCVYG